MARTEVVSRRRAVEDAVSCDHRMFVGGQWSDAATGGRMDVVDPTTERVLGTVPVATGEDVDLAVERAEAAQPAWARASWSHRADALYELARRVEARADDICALDAVDAGLTMRGMVKDVANAVAYLRYHAALASELKGETIQLPGAGVSFTLREPYGVVGRIVPFNHPFQFAAHAIGAPLSAGNAVILKPADQTPLSALVLAELAEGVLEPGLLSVLTGDGATGRSIVVHPRVRRLGFTGSAATATQVMQDAAPFIKNLSFELGGKNPMVIFPDVDIDKAADACVLAMNLVRCQGQACGSPSRVFVHTDIRPLFVGALAERLDALRVGDPLEDEVDMGPLAFRAHHERVMSYVGTGITEGGQLVTGGRRPDGLATGYFVEPTLFDGVTTRMTIAREEIFGPVISVLEWDSLERVVADINELDHGLTANIWTNDLTRAIHLARAVHAGYVYVNGRGQRPLGAPFGGYGMSGLGKENDLSELLSYTRVKNVLLDLDDPTDTGVDT